MSDPKETPVDIDVVRDRAVTVTFDDGETCVFGVEELRSACPCASCRGWRERGEVAWPRPGVPTTIAILDASLNGAWGLTIDWDDGHSTGIYAWSTLRRWWDAGKEGGLVVDPVPHPGPGTSPDAPR